MAPKKKPPAKQAKKAPEEAPASPVQLLSASSKIAKPTRRSTSKSKATQVNKAEMNLSSSREEELMSLLEAYGRDPNGDQGPDPKIPGYLSPHPPNSRPLKLDDTPQHAHHMPIPRPFRSLERAAQFLTSPGLPRRTSARCKPGSSTFAANNDLANARRAFRLQPQESSDDSISTSLQMHIDQRIEAYLGANNFPQPRNARFSSDAFAADHDDGHANHEVPLVATDMKRGTSRTMSVSEDLKGEYHGVRVDVWPGPGHGPPIDDDVPVDPSNLTGSIFTHVSPQAAADFSTHRQPEAWRNSFIAELLDQNEDEMVPVHAATHQPAEKLNPGQNTANPSHKVFLPKESYIFPQTRTAAFSKSIFSPDHPINKTLPTKPSTRPTRSSLFSSSSRTIFPAKSVTFNFPPPPSTPLTSTSDISPVISLPPLKPFHTRIPARHTNHALAQNLYAAYAAATHTLYASAMTREHRLITTYKRFLRTQDTLISTRHNEIKSRVRLGLISDDAATEEFEALVQSVGVKEAEFKRKVEGDVARLVERTERKRKRVDGETEDDYLVKRMEADMARGREGAKKRREKEAVVVKGRGTGKVM